MTENIRTANAEFANWYEQRCRDATTAQGLDPIVEVIRDAGIPVSVDQTGGFCMCVRVDLVEGNSQFLWLTVNDGDVYEGDVVIGRYWDCGDNIRANDAVECDAWCTPPDAEVGIAPLDDVVIYIRREVDRSPVPCPSCDYAGWLKAVTK